MHDIQQIIHTISTLCVWENSIFNTSCLNLGPFVYSFTVEILIN